MVKLLAAKFGYLKNQSFFSLEISLLQSAMLLQIYMRFEAVHRYRTLAKCVLNVF